MNFNAQLDFPLSDDQGTRQWCSDSLRFDTGAAILVDIAEWNSVAKLLAAMEPDQVLLEAVTVFDSCALLLGVDGGPAGFPQSFNHRVGGKEGVAVAGCGVSRVCVGGGRKRHEPFAAEFIGGAAPKQVGVWFIHGRDWPIITPGLGGFC